MKLMPLPIHLHGNTRLHHHQLLLLPNSTTTTTKFVSELPPHYTEPTSVLDSARFPTSSSSHDTAGVAAAASSDPSPKWRHDSTTATSSDAADVLLPIPPSFEIAGNPAMEDWESVLSESVAVFPTQEQSFLRWIMGDVDDHKPLQIASAAPDLAFSAGFGAHGFDAAAECFVPNFPTTTRSEKDNIGGFVSNLVSNSFNSSAAETKPSIFQNHPSSFFFPLPYPQDPQITAFPGPPLPKRHNPGRPGPYTDTGQQLQLLPPQIGNSHQLQQQAIVDQIYKAADHLQTGNPALAHGILARLNHHLSLVGKPFHRAAFYCKEALQLLLNTTTITTNFNPFNLVFKIGAYKSFSEISPLVQFANFTSNQAILESLEGFDRVHVLDFDIGLGGQWGSLMQELALRPGGLSSLKVTALSSMSPHDQLELGLTRENLIQFASEVNIPFEFEAVSDSLNSGSWFRAPENEAVVVNLPVGSLAPFVLRFVKHLRPRIVVTMDRGCDRTDLPFANHVIHALQSYSNLLESLDAVNANSDSVQKIERFLLQPGLEKVVRGRFQSSPEKTQHWRDLFLSSGLSPVGFSNFAESQAECLVKRTPVRGFQVEKRQSSLVLSWQRKELVSVSAWRVC